MSLIKVLLKPFRSTKFLNCRGATVLAVAGDSTSGKRADARLASGSLQAAKEAGARRFVLITPQGGAASGGGLLGLFGLGGGGGSGGRSSLEQEVRLGLPGFSQGKILLFSLTGCLIPDPILSSTSISSDRARSDNI